MLADIGKPKVYNTVGFTLLGVQMRDLCLLKVGFTRFPKSFGCSVIFKATHTQAYFELREELKWLLQKLDNKVWSPVWSEQRTELEQRGYWPSKLDKIRVRIQKLDFHKFGLFCGSFQKFILSPNLRIQLVIPETREDVEHFSSWKY